jgi:DNA-binding beta-propeller fold protein YncE
MLYRRGLRGLFAVLFGLLSHNPARGDQIFVSNNSSGTIGEYTTAGETVNAALISGLSSPNGIAVSGSDLFVANGGVIGKYTTAGATVNRALISGLRGPFAIAVSGSDLFVTNVDNGTIGAYTPRGLR